jgi:hypothetical protein
MLPTHHEPNVLVDRLGRRLVAAKEVRHNLALGNHQDLVGTGDGVLVVDGERCVSRGDCRTPQRPLLPIAPSSMPSEDRDSEGLLG